MTVPSSKNPKVLRRAREARKKKGYRWLTPLERLAENPASRKLAIEAKCWHCQGGGVDPSPYWRIGNCPETECPLWWHRPYQSRYKKPMPQALETWMKERGA